MEVVRFRTTADLEGLLARYLDGTDVLIMAAAVADYRPKPNPAAAHADGKLKRTAAGMTIELEATPDLLAGCAARRRPGQTLVGFALEPRSRLLESARAKLGRKGLDFIVANPLETMDAEDIEAVVLGKDGTSRETGGAIGKEAFASWLLGLI